MSNGEVCCILGVCCPPAKVRQTFTDHLVSDTACPEEYAKDVVDWVLSRFDLAPKGTLQPLIDSVATMARAKPQHGD